MTLSQTQIEWIVSEVVRRLRESGAVVNSVATAPRSASAPTPDSGRSLAVSARLVTLETLRDCSDGINRLEVSHRAIVTPAAVDWLNDKKIELVRGAIK